VPQDLFDTLQAALASDYSLERELGGGGMGRVFLATETELGRRVVIKVLAPELALGVTAERFRREIQVAASLQHPHIVPLLTAGRVKDLLYYTMPYVEGESLRARIAREGELPVAEAVRILTEVARALAYAHRQGVVHRDIKPDNILLAEGEAQVADFGIAKARCPPPPRGRLSRPSAWPSAHPRTWPRSRPRPIPRQITAWICTPSALSATRCWPVSPHSAAALRSSSSPRTPRKSSCQSSGGAPQCRRRWRCLI
jgi:serine/threonine protein kinase